MSSSQLTNIFQRGRSTTNQKPFYKVYPVDESSMLLKRLVKLALVHLQVGQVYESAVLWTVPPKVWGGWVVGNFSLAEWVWLYDMI